MAILKNRIFWAEVFFKVYGIEPLQIFLRLHDGKLNRKLIILDFGATQCFLRFETDPFRGSQNTVSHKVT